MLTQSFLNCAAFLQILLQVLLEQGQTLFKGANLLTNKERQDTQTTDKQTK